MFAMVTPNEAAYVSTAGFDGILGAVLSEPQALSRAAAPNTGTSTDRRTTDAARRVKDDREWRMCLAVRAAWDRGKTNKERDTCPANANAKT